MRLWPRKKPEPVVRQFKDDVMVSWYRDDEMVEAAFVTLETMPGTDNMGASEETVVDLPAGVNRVVYEMPWGCVEHDYDPGDSSLPSRFTLGLPTVEVSERTVMLRSCRRTLLARATSPESGRDQA